MQFSIALGQRAIRDYEQEHDVRSPQEVITIPVIVHVVHNGQAVGSGPNISRAKVQSQIDALNEDYRRSGAGFNNHPAGEKNFYSTIPPARRPGLPRRRS